MHRILINPSYVVCYTVCFLFSAGIFKQSTGARNRVGMGYRTGPPRYIGLIPGLLKSLKIRAQS